MKIVCSRIQKNRKETKIMNKVILIGRLTKDADIKTSSTGMSIARFNLAVDRRLKKDNEQTCDFISCVAFSKTAEFLEKYGKKGTKFVVEGSIQTGSYTNKDGNKVYTTDVAVQSVEFAESKVSAQNNDTPAPAQASAIPDGFIKVDDIDEDELPFA
jgi:single-strand DNA-binding protein